MMDQKILMQQQFRSFLTVARIKQNLLMHYLQDSKKNIRR